EAPAGVAAAPATSRPAALPPADGPDAGKKKPPDPGDGVNGAARRLTTDSLAHVWSEILTHTGPILAREVDRAGLPAIFGAKHLVWRFQQEYNAQCEYCADRARLQRVQEAVKRVTGQPWAVRLEIARHQNGQAPPTPAPAPASARPPAALSDPLILRAIE